MASLEELQEELILSAQFGQQLLEENAKLKVQIERLSTPKDSAPAPSGEQTHRAPTVSSEQYILQIEKANQDLNQRLEATLERLDGVQRALEQSERRRNDESVGLKHELFTANQRAEQLTEENEKMQKEKIDTVKKEKDGKKAETLEVQTLRRRVDELEEACAQFQKEKELAEKEVDKREEDVNTLLEQCRELEDQVQEIESLREGEAACFTKIFELETALAQSRDEAGQLRATIKTLGGNDDTVARLALVKEDDLADADANSKSLFSEVDDRRKELEGKHMDLSSKHAGLMKQHNMSLHQHERMRNHIARLSQLSLAKGEQEHTRRLEAALAEKESENRELLTKISGLERSGGGKPLHLEMSSTSPISDLETLGALRLKLHHLSTVNDGLKKEGQTSRMMRLAETQKLRTTEMALSEKDAELEQERAKFAQAKYELEELKLKLKAQQEGVDLEEDGLFVVAGTGTSREPATPHVAPHQTMNQRGPPVNGAASGPLQPRSTNRHIPVLGSTPRQLPSPKASLSPRLRTPPGKSRIPVAVPTSPKPPALNPHTSTPSKSLSLSEPLSAAATLPSPADSYQDITTSSAASLDHASPLPRPDKVARVVPHGTAPQDGPKKVYVKAARDTDENECTTQ